MEVDTCFLQWQPESPVRTLDGLVLLVPVADADELAASHSLSRAARFDPATSPLLKTDSEFSRNDYDYDHAKMYLKSEKNANGRIQTSSISLSSMRCAMLYLSESVMFRKWAEKSSSV